MHSVSVHDLSVTSTPRPLDRTAAHGQPTEALVSARGLFSFVQSWDYWRAFCLCSFSVFGHRFRVVDYCKINQIYNLTGNILGSIFAFFRFVC
jgi:hypothetical protein